MKRRLHLLFVGALLLTCSSCGEFRTAHFYDFDSLEQGDVAQDVPEEEVGPDICAGVTPLSLVLDEILPGRVYEPIQIQLQANVEGLLWRVVSGALPAGVEVGALSGLLSGVPLEAGTFNFVLRISDPAIDESCKSYEDFSLAWTVLSSCQTDMDCEEGASGVALHCSDVGCLMSSKSCDGAASRMRFDWSGHPPDPETTWTVQSHHKLVGYDYDPKSGYRHQMELVSGLETRLLLYSSPRSLPLPVRAGDTVNVTLRSWNQGLGHLIRFDGIPEAPGGMLYDGPEAFAGQVLDLLAGLGIDQMELLPTSCPGSEDQCGIQNTGALSLAGDGVSLEVGVEETADWATDDGTQRLVVGSAYEYRSFDPSRCADVSPSYASFRIAAGDRCPAPLVLSSSKGVEFLSDAFVGTPVVYFFATVEGGESSAPIAHWSWVLEQPFEGLAALSQKGGSLSESGTGPLELRMPVCGPYRINLGAEDAEGRVSCIDDVVEVRVLPDPGLDLRMELAWQGVDGSGGEDEDVDLLLRFPGDYEEGDFGAQEWVCSEDNPYPLEWMLGYPDHHDYVCQCSAGNMELGRPEVITLKTLHDDFIQPYAIGVRASAENAGPVRVMLQVYLSGKLVYRRVDRELEPGELWRPGNISSIYRAFFPVQG